MRFVYQRYMQDYLAVVTAMDENIGRLLDYLDESGLAENTVVIYTSDQGFYLGEHGWYDKRWMYEESLHTPLLIRWPGVTPQGSETGALIQNIDIAPTLLEAAGAPIPDDMQGESFAPFLHGEEPDGWRDAIYYHYYEGPAGRARRAASLRRSLRALQADPLLRYRRVGAVRPGARPRRDAKRVRRS